MGQFYRQEYFMYISNTFNMILKCFGFFFSDILMDSVLLLQAFLVAISQSAALMQRKGPQFLIRTAHTFQPYTPEEEKGRSCLSRTAAPLLTPLKVPHFFQKFPTLLIHRNHLWHRTGRTMYPVMGVLFNHLQSHCWCTLPNH